MNKVDELGVRILASGAGYFRRTSEPHGYVPTMTTPVIILKTGSYDIIGAGCGGMQDEPPVRRRLLRRRRTRILNCGVVGFSSHCEATRHAMT